MCSCDRRQGSWEVRLDMSCPSGHHIRPWVNTIHGAILYGKKCGNMIVCLRVDIVSEACVHATEERVHEQCVHTCPVPQDTILDHGSILSMGQ